MADEDYVRRGVSSPFTLGLKSHSKQQNNRPRQIPSIIQRERSRSDPWIDSCCLEFNKSKEYEKKFNPIINALTSAIKKKDSTELIQILDEKEDINVINQIDSIAVTPKSPNQRKITDLKKVKRHIHTPTLPIYVSSYTQQKERRDSSKPALSRSISFKETVKINKVTLSTPEQKEEKRSSPREKFEKLKKKIKYLDKTENFLPRPVRRLSPNSKTVKQISPRRLYHSNKSFQRHSHEFVDPVATALNELNLSLLDIPEFEYIYNMKTYDPKQSPLLSEPEKKSLVFLPSNKFPIAGLSEALIVLTLENITEENRLKTFIYAHEQFITPVNLMKKLISYYNFSRNLEQNKEVQYYIQMRIVLFLCRWFNLNLKPFNDKDSLLVKEINNFIEELRQSDDNFGKTWAKLVKKSLVAEKCAHDTDKRILDCLHFSSENLKKSNTESNILSGLFVLDFEKEKLAKQLSILDHKMFSDIPLSEFLNKNWAKETTSPNIHKLINMFNIVSKWVTTEIATTISLKGRVQTLSFFISLADELKKLHSYHSLFAIMYGICRTPITRLTNTWKALPSSQLKRFNELENFVKPTGNFKVLRESTDKLSNSDTPFTVPLSVIMKDLTSIEEGNNDWHNKGKKILNYEKIELLGKIMNVVVQSQQNHYKYSPVDIIQEYLWNLYYLEDDDLISYSKKIEPPNIDL